MSEQQSQGPAGETLTELQGAAEAYRRARDAVDEHGREELEDVASALDRARTLLSQFEDTATDTGAREFVNYAQFEARFSNHVESLDDDLPARDAFEAAFEAVDKTRLSEDDFERAREALEPAAALVERLDDLEDARDRLRTARRDAERRRADLESRRSELERVLELGEADLDAPVEELRDPVERWNGAVEDGIAELRRDESAREAFGLLDRAEQYPLVDLPSPPAELREYVAESPAGTESIATLLEYAEFSRSKLEHYVDDPGQFRRVVGVHRTTLEAVDAEPLTVDWPPPPPEEVPWLVRSLRAVAGGLVTDDAVAALREVATAARDEGRYRRLRTAAVARAELDAEDRRRLQDGRVAAERDSVERAIERVEDRLAALPEP